MSRHLEMDEGAEKGRKEDEISVSEESLHEEDLPGTMKAVAQETELKARPKEKKRKKLKKKKRKTGSLRYEKIDGFAADKEEKH